MGGKGLVWDVKDSLAADTDAPYRARICHAARGEALRGGRYARLRRAGGREREREREQPTTARRCSVVAWIRMLSDSERRPSATACPLTAASPSASSVSPLASSASPTSRNARCFLETLTASLLNQGRPSGRSSFYHLSLLTS